MPLYDFCKVLIVDDELLTRQGIKHYIDWEKEGFKIVGEASDGKEALRIINQKQPHIVITDMVMPVMDGEELTRIIKKDYPHIEIIILSSFGDFEYVRSTFQHGIADYILKPQLEGPILLNALKKAAYRLPEFTLMPDNNNTTISIGKIINRVMAGYGLDNDVSIIEQTFPYSQFCLLGIEFKSNPKYKLEILQPLKDKINEEMQKKFTRIPYEPISTNQNSMAFLLNIESDQLQMIKQFIKVIANSSVFSEIDVSWALTEPFPNFSDLKSNYEEKLLPLFNYRFYFPKTNIFIYDGISNIPYHEGEFQLMKFTEAFKRQQFEFSFQYLEDHTKKLAHEYTLDEFAFKSFLGNIIFNITVLLGNMGYESEQLEKEKYSYISKIDEALFANDALKEFDDFLIDAKAIISETSVDETPPNMQRFLNYIDENYEKSLSLTEIAGHFHYNPSYLSNYFSEHNKTGFNEYLNQVRIEKSIEWLRDGKKPIAEISLLVGYTNHSYYCRVFKNLMGVSPSRYRRQYFRLGHSKNE